MALVAALLSLLERRLEHSPEFPVGLLLGQLTVLATVLLNGLFLILGGEADYHLMVMLTIIVHLPLAVIEGVVLGFIIEFLARVKPEMIGWSSETGSRSQESEVGGQKSEVGKEAIRL